MAGIETMLVGAIVMTLIGLIVWLIQANFNDLKKALEDINEKIVDKAVCQERHRAVNEKLKGHDDRIKHLEEV